MIIVLSGAPGAGKGTQADLLVSDQGYRKVSTGDALRNQIKAKSALGLEAEGYMKEGKLVPDHLLFKVLTAELEANKGRTILLDGYPRNVNQAKTLANLGGESQVRACVHLDVGQVELVARLSGRRVCGACGASYHVEYAPPGDGDKCTKCGGGVVQRPDDAADKVAVRLDVYQRETMPVLDFYMGAGIYKRVDGARETNIVFGDLKKVIEGLAKA